MSEQDEINKEMLALVREQVKSMTNLQNLVLSQGAVQMTLARVLEEAIGLMKAEAPQFVASLQLRLETKRDATSDPDEQQLLTRCVGLVKGDQ